MCFSVSSSSTYTPIITSSSSSSSTPTTAEVSRTPFSTTPIITSCTHLPLPRGRWVQNVIMGVVVDCALTSAEVGVEKEVAEEVIMGVEVQEVEEEVAENAHGTLPRLGGSHASES